VGCFSSSRAAAEGLQFPPQHQRNDFGLGCAYKYFERNIMECLLSKFELGVAANKFPPSRKEKIYFVIIGCF
jgi:hypothetical protein